MIDLEFNHCDGYAKQVSDYRIEYGKDYYEQYKQRGNTAIERAIMRGRADFVNKYRNSLSDGVLDIGIGNGEFVRIMGAKGVDVNKQAIFYLKKRNYYNEHINRFNYVCMWDVLEHLEDFSVLNQIKDYLFISLPVYFSLYDVRTSKHYKPGEHLWYFTETGLVKMMDKYCLDLVEKRDFEKKAGRHEIYSYCFRRKK
jgi:hypothetical protein